MADRQEYEDWWVSMTPDAQMDYLADHPKSKKKKDAVAKLVGAMSDEERSQHSAAVNNMLKDADSFYEKNLGKSLSPSSLKEAKPKEYAKLEATIGNLFEEENQSGVGGEDNTTERSEPKGKGDKGSDKERKARKERIEKVAKIAVKAALITAGVSFIALRTGGNPLLAIATIVLIRDDLKGIYESAMAATDSTKATAKLVMNTGKAIKKRLGNQEKVQDSIVPNPDNQSKNQQANK